jgi:putative Mg2+ transporter-C (MgtC) family protein
MTVIGLCFGGGQLILGCVGSALIVIALIGFKWVDFRIPRQRRARVVIAGVAGDPSMTDVYSALAAAGYRAIFLRQENGGDGHRTLTTFEVRWDQPEVAGPPQQLLAVLKQSYDVETFDVIVEGTH